MQRTSYLFYYFVYIIWLYWAYRNFFNDPLSEMQPHSCSGTIKGKQTAKAHIPDIEHCLQGVMTDTESIRYVQQKHQYALLKLCEIIAYAHRYIFNKEEHQNRFSTPSGITEGYC